MNALPGPGNSAQACSTLTNREMHLMVFSLFIFSWHSFANIIEHMYEHTIRAAYQNTVIFHCIQFRIFLLNISLVSLNDHFLPESSVIVVISIVEGSCKSQLSVRENKYLRLGSCCSMQNLLCSHSVLEALQMS